jgi:hypothetical protein
VGGIVSRTFDIPALPSHPTVDFDRDSYAAAKLQANNSSL